MMMLDRLFLLLLLCSSRVSAFQPLIPCQGCGRAVSGRTTTSSTRIYAQKPKKVSYARPSAAIERGSGFFVPGLEGSRVRVVAGIVLILGVVLNQGTGLADALACVFASLLLIQAGYELFKPQQQDVNEDAVFQQRWLVPIEDEEWRAHIEWAAVTYLSLTSTSSMFLVGQPGVAVYCLGQQKQEETIPQQGAMKAAWQSLAQSSSGRIALSNPHPTVQALVVQTVIVQRISPDLAWLVTSNSPLNKSDLQWLGLLAEYVANE